MLEPEERLQGLPQRNIGIVGSESGLRGADELSDLSFQVS
jgi:hypothetical protein